MRFKEFLVKLSEEEQKKYHDFHEWMAAVKVAYPDKQIRFKIAGDDHVAYVRDEIPERLYGIWSGDDDGEGIVFGADE